MILKKEPVDAEKLRKILTSELLTSDGLNIPGNSKYVMIYVYYEE